MFGAGGDRDPGKRPLMGEAAAENADIVIVTDDNPRTEDPAAIRAAILAAAPGARSRSATGARRSPAPSPCSRPGDVLCIAGKGHETGQIVGGERAAVLRPSQAVAGSARRGGGRMSAPLWTFDELVGGDRRAGRSAPQPGAITGISIDSRSLEPGDAFFAIRGERLDGHDFVGPALARGCGDRGRRRGPAGGRSAG